MMNDVRGRYVFPVTGPPIRDGVVTIRGERIVAVGHESAGGPVEDLGNVAILPGLVNAHTHLDFSTLEEPLGEPGMGFVEWTARVMAFRLGQPAGQAIERGIQESIRCGTTTLGEIAQPGWPVGAFADAPLASTVFLELIAPIGQRVGPALESARQHLREKGDSPHLCEAPFGPFRQMGTVPFFPSAGRWRPGLSPHAPYTVHPRLLAAAVSLSAERRVPVAMHLAESREEIEFLRSAGGPIRQRLEELGLWDPSLAPPGRRPLDYLHALALTHRALVIHGNYLNREEIAFLAERSQRMAVVYCPRTHAWFNHAAYPLEDMLAAGVNVALGTDSRASSPDLSLLAEMRFAAQRHPTVGRDAILRLGTIDAARALGLETEIGSLEPGKYADLATVALPDHDAADLLDLLFASAGQVTGRYYHGAKDHAPPS